MDVNSNKFQAPMEVAEHEDTSKANTPSNAKQFVKTELDCFLDLEFGAPMALAKDEIDTDIVEYTSVLIDPGASGSAIPTGECNDIPLEDINRSRLGYAYEVAGGHRIINEGQRNMTRMSQDGDLNNMEFQVVGANKPFLSVIEFVDAGHRIVLESGGAYIENEKGRRSRLTRSNGMWYFVCWRIPRKIAVPKNSISLLQGRAG